MIHETHHPARVDRLAEADSDVPNEIGWRSAVGAPIVVEGRLWGAMDVGSKTDQPLPAGTEERLTEFTALLASAIANAESRAEVDASRARIVATADETRRRIERDLHDGAQQQLVSLALEMRALQAGCRPSSPSIVTSWRTSPMAWRGVIDDLREIALGLHPAILGGGWPRAGLEDDRPPIAGPGRAPRGHRSAGCPSRSRSPPTTSSRRR